MNAPWSREERELDSEAREVPRDPFSFPAGAKIIGVVVALAWIAGITALAG